MGRQLKPLGTEADIRAYRLKAAQKHQEGKTCISIWVRTELLNSYKEQAGESEVTLSQVIRLLLRDWSVGKIDLKL